MNAKMKKFLSVLLAASMTLGSVNSLSTAVTAAEQTGQTSQSSQQTGSENDGQSSGNATNADSQTGSDSNDSNAKVKSNSDSSGTKTNANENKASEEASDSKETAPAYSSVSSLVLDDAGDILYVKATAEEGVLPEGAVFTASKVDTEESKAAANTAISSVRDTKDLLTGSYLLDLSFTTADGSPVEPTGEVNLSIGLVDKSSLSSEANSSVTSYLTEEISTRVIASTATTDTEALNAKINEKLSELSLSYSLSDLSLNLYHLTVGEDANLSAAKVDLTKVAVDENMPEAGLISGGKVSSFSQYQVELSLPKDSFSETIDTISKSLISDTIPDVTPDDTLADSYSYRISGANSISVAELAAALEESGEFPAVTITSGDTSDSYVSYTGTGTERTFTIPVGGDSYAITLYDETGNSYQVNLYSDLPKVTKKEDANFTILWNDNGGSDAANLVERPSWDDIKDNYVIKYSIDGGEAQTLAEDSLAAYGLESVPELTPDTSSLTSWTFSLENLPTSYTENIGEGKQEHKISYYIEQTKTPDSYLNISDSSLIEMNSSIINTVYALFQTKVIWLDNNNAYSTRPAREDITNLLQKGTIKVMRYEANSSAAPVDISSSLTRDNFTFEDHEDEGYELNGLIGLPAYCEDESNYGAPYIYSIIFNPELDPNTPEQDASAEYISTYQNLDNYASYTGALYNGGTLTERLSDTIDFSYTKEWDDNNNNNRPSAKIYFYVTTEDAVTSDSFNPNHASAVDGYSSVDVPKEDGTYTVCTNLPKYNEKGQKLVYFALEKGLGGDYISGVDNSTGTASQDVIDTFDQIKGSYTDPDTNESYPKYLLNNGKIDNRLSASVTASVTKTLNAVSMQEMSGAEINLVLQKMVAETADDGSISYQWVKASRGDLYGHDATESGDITLTLNGFRAENMSQTGESDPLKKYDENGASVIYRWKEVSAAINGSDSVEVNWNDTENVSPDSMSYETAEDVSIGKFAPGIGDEMTDFYLSGRTETTLVGNGSSQTDIENNINAPYLIKVKKTWTVDGKNLTDQITGEGAYAKFEILDSSGNPVEDDQGNPLTITLTADDLSSDGSKWEQVYNGLARFDQDGREISYSLKEVSWDDGGYAEEQGLTEKWNREIRYSAAVDTTGKDDETAKEMVASVSNYIVGPGTTVTLSAQKIWNDDDDLISRAPVVIGIYYSGEDGYGLVDTISLTEAGFWYEKTTVSEGDYYYQYQDGQWTAVGTLPKTITSDDFVLVELATGSTTSVTPVIPEGLNGKEAEVAETTSLQLPARESTLSKMNFGSEEDPVYRTYEEWSASDISSIKGSIGDSDTALGMIADDTEDPEGDSNYTYAVSARKGYISYAEMDGYIWTDTRVGKLNLDLTKTWNDGDEIRPGHFALYRDDSDEPVFEFDLGYNNDPGPIAKIKEFIDDAVDSLLGIDLGLGQSGKTSGQIPAYSGSTYTITAETETSEQGIDLVKYYNIQLENLPKYDQAGRLYSYTLKETGIYSDDGELVPLENGKATVDDHAYVSSCKLDTTKGDDGTVYGDLHHSGDWTYWKASNSLEGSFNLNFHKVWYDNADEASLRPNVYFDIYRVSSGVWINNNSYTIREWLESDTLWKEDYSEYGSQEAALGYLLSKYYSYSGAAEKIATIDSDRYYDASQNKYLWSIDIGNVAQYDENGYPYIYFAIEGNISSDSDYYGNTYYGNMKWDDLHVNVSGKTAKDTYNIYSAEDYDKYMSDSVLILADGVHKNGNDVGNYYSRVIVNAKSETRSVSGRKIWNTNPIRVSQSNLPTVKMALYRSTTPITTEQDIDEYSQSQMDEWIKNTSATKVAEFTLNDDTAGDYSFTGYTYSIKYEDLDGDGVADTRTVYDDDGKEVTEKAELQKYDEYGNIYYYYTLELGDKDGNEIPGYKDDPTYNAAYFYLTNVYDVRKQPYVEISVTKNWTIAAEALEENPNLKVKDLSDVDITLYAVMQDESGDPVGDPIAMQTINYDPNPDDTSAYDSCSINDKTGTITATFSKYVNADAQGDSTLPYYAPNGRPFLYYVSESAVNGYDSTITSGGKTEAASVQSDARTRLYINLEEGKDGIYRNTVDDQKESFDNTYTGDPTVDFSPVKYWSDGYVDNSAYRPAKIRLTIQRYSTFDSGEYEDGTTWNRSVIFEKTENNQSASSWTVHNTSAKALTKLQKYDIFGNAYTYYIAKEEFLDKDGNVIATAYNKNDIIGSYQLSNKTDRTLTNTLNDRVSVELNKEWKYEVAGEEGTKTFTYEAFDALRKMNALPSKVKFVVERTTSASDPNSWTSVDASTDDSDHKITVNDSSVVGYEVDLSNITADTFGALFNTKVTWENLPAKDLAGNSYTYRISEILTWRTTAEDGSVIENDVTYTDGTSDKGISSSFNVFPNVDELTGVYTYHVDAVNTLETKKVRLAKEWIDYKGRDHTRPSTLTMTIKPKNSDEPGLSFDLKTSGASGEDLVDHGDGTVSSFYYSDYFLIPGYITEQRLFDLSDFSSYFDVVEASITGANYSASDVNWCEITEDDGSSSYLATITNKLTDDRKSITLAVWKSWENHSGLSDEKDWRDTEAIVPRMQFTLQYLKQGGNKNNEADWISLSDTQTNPNYIGKFTVPSDPTYTPTATYEIARDKYVGNYYYWRYLKKYWDTPTTDGKSELISYRVVEERVDGKSTNINSYIGHKKDDLNTKWICSFNMTDDQDTYGNYSWENTLQDTKISIKKNWKDQSGTAFDLATVKDLVKLKALPERIEFKIYYKLDGQSDYTDTKMTVDFAVTDLADSTKSTKVDGLPRYDANGKEIQYQFEESQVRYQGGEWQSAGAGLTLQTKEFNSLEDGKQTVTFDNTIQTTSKTVTKTFLDENNRDGLQGDVVVQLYRDDVAYGDPVTLNKTNSWTKTWSNLPKYKNDASSLTSDQESVYVVKEVSVNGIAINDSAYTARGGTFTDASGNVSDSTIISNIHTPYRGTITAAKEWNDYDNKYGSRMNASVYLALQVKNPTTKAWEFVTEKASFDDNGQYQPASGSTIPIAYTSSALIQEANGSDKTATWNDLPVNYNGEKLTYRVVEVTGASSTTIKTSSDIDGYTLTYPEASFANKDQDQQTLNLTVRNSLITQTSSITKVWNNDDDWSSLRPGAITIEVNWTHGDQSGSGVKTSDGQWHERITLNKGNNWTCDNILLPLYDTDGNAYSYTITEKYNFGGQEISKSCYSMDLSLANATSSNWQISQVTGSENSWQLTLKNTASENTDTKLALTATNTLKTGSLTVTKNWNDDQNREADRKNITVQLYRNGSKLKGYEATLSPDNNWSYTWNNLPIYTRDGETKWHYTIQETNAGDDWTVNYEENAEYVATHGIDKNPTGITFDESGDGKSKTTKITNTIQPNYFNITASKAWEDANDRYGVSAKTLYVKLQYSTDQTNWSDVESTPTTDAYVNGTKVYTSSNLIQEIEITGIGDQRVSSLANWTDLPEKVRTTNDATGGTSKTVYYRVVECKADGTVSANENTDAYYSQSSSVITYADAKESGAAKTASITLTNRLPMGSLSVSKTWDDSDSSLRPDKVEVKLYRLYSKEDGSTEESLLETQTLNKGDETSDPWTYTWQNLPVQDKNGKLIQYKVTEVAIGNGYTTSYSSTGEEASWTDTPSALTLTQDQTSTTYIKNSQTKGSISVDKSWEDSGYEKERPTTITYSLYRGNDSTPYKTQTVNVGSDGSATYTFSDLPVYDKDGSAFIYRVEEESFDGYETSYAISQGTPASEGETDAVKLDTISSASITVTNKIKLGQITVTKSWVDEANRENKRGNITLNLYRDGGSSPYRSWSSESEGTPGFDFLGNWTYTFTNLPIYQAGGKTLSSYRLEEVCDDSDYSASWSTTVDQLQLNTADQTVSTTVTNTYAPKKGRITAKKIWDDYDNVMNTRPKNDQVTLKLQYSLDGTTWQDISKNTAESDTKMYQDGGIYTTSDVEQIADGNKLFASWENLPVYYYNQTTGDKAKVLYRVQEVNVPSGYTVSTDAESISLDETKTYDDKEVAVTNTLTTSTGLTIKKVWNENGADASLIRPLALRFYIEYRLKNGSDWTALPNTAYDKESSTAEVSGGYVTMTSNATSGWGDIVIAGLPERNASNVEYEYRVRELAYSYTSNPTSRDFVDVTSTSKGDSYAGAYEISYSSDNEGGDSEPHEDADNIVNSKGTVTVTNTLPTANLKVSKKWMDEDDRDQIRPSASGDAGITLQLYRDEEKYGDPVRVYQTASGDANTWEYEWKNLPLYMTEAGGSPASYYVVETSVDGYETIYNDGKSDYGKPELSNTTLDQNWTKELIVKNIHTPKKTSLTASKIWDDNSDLFAKRPDSIYLSLMYKIEGSEADWALVTQAPSISGSDGQVRYVDGGVHTTSTVIQEIQTGYSEAGNSQQTSWADLPKNVVVDGVSKKVIYQAFETNAEGKAVGKTSNGYRVSYESGDAETETADVTESADSSKGSAFSQTIKNKLMTTSMTIHKDWTGDESWTNLVRPTAITFLVETSLDGGENWTAYSQDGEDAICVNGFVTMKGSAEENWEDLVLNDLPLITEDGNFYQYRVSEYSIEINGQTVLCQTKSSDASSDTDAKTQTVSSKAGAYDGQTTTKQNEDETWSVTATNSLESGSISVSKTWADGNNRDGLRPDSISLDLHRVDTIGEQQYDEVIDTVTIKADADGNWPTYTWKDLPIWSRDGQTKASYYVTEKDVSGYTSSYQTSAQKADVAETAANAASNLSADASTAIKVTNTHTNASFTIQASKIWDDNTNARGLRDESVSFTLQYSLDNGKTWQKVKKLKESAIPDAAKDKGTSVWTSSDVTQSISGKMTDSEWTGFSWKGLPAYALDAKGNTVEVQYRVTEEQSKNMSANYTVTEGSVLSYGKAKDGIASTSITNKVNPAAASDSKASNSSKSGKVKTGDDSQYILWALLMTGAFISMLYTGARYKKKREDE